MRRVWVAEMDERLVRLKSRHDGLRREVCGGTSQLSHPSATPSPLTPHHLLKPPVWTSPCPWPEKQSVVTAVVPGTPHRL